AVNVLRQLVKVIIVVDKNKDEKEVREYKVSDLKFRQHHHRNTSDADGESAQELKELEALERREKNNALS
ncbi:MAG: stage 0 sporulation protein, partial [Lachnospiraceae bacterium]|nr:stage 0 sporulation protein [Lachnospiraceae bacterium]